MRGFGDPRGWWQRHIAVRSGYRAALDLPLFGPSGQLGSAFASSHEHQEVPPSHSDGCRVPGRRALVDCERTEWSVMRRSKGLAVIGGLLAVVTAAFVPARSQAAGNGRDPMTGGGAPDATARLTHSVTPGDGLTILPAFARAEASSFDGFAKPAHVVSIVPLAA